MFTVFKDLVILTNDGVAQKKHQQQQQQHELKLFQSSLHCKQMFKGFRGMKKVVQIRSKAKI